MAAWGKYAKKPMSERERERFIEKRKDQVARWRSAKAYVAAHPEEVESLMAAAAFSNDGQISQNSFMFVYLQMQELKLEGTPYIDTRTFQKWREVGRSVKRGETARLVSITWIGREPEVIDAETGETDNPRMWPKATALFHISQTEEIIEKATA